MKRRIQIVVKMNDVVGGKIVISSSAKSFNDTATVSWTQKYTNVSDMNAWKKIKCEWYGS